MTNEPVSIMFCVCGYTEVDHIENELGCGEFEPWSLELLCTCNHTQGDHLIGCDVSECDCNYFHSK